MKPLQSEKSFHRKCSGPKYWLKIHKILLLHTVKKLSSDNTVCIVCTM